ncbi:MAG: hypothetical protein GX950_01535 [Candidatus Diapherotrites archaeon]|uniref:Universal stress protein n=1 Tax=Candidatus Iainarchaeum sp. TaxID=3101447 RepID=A0A7K4BZ19_9ARCH|nr:hypothetical protein [Candidatus Diapherotrites archaeon]
MNILVPLLSGKEDNPEFIKAITTNGKKIILLQIVDKEFLTKTSTAMGEVMQNQALLTKVKKSIQAKKKKVEEITEWGTTIKKILSIAILQKVDKVFLVKQDNQFFGDILKAMKKEKIPYEIIEVKDEEKKEKGFNFLNKLNK